ncbi:hypothetical protein A3H16_01980 [Candidatus Kaiserbacteria bacterium RIFCSPLOWO2_12_FULL_53_8]|uniref:Transcriptional repressor PaaX-like central Cas2-like domain-containing protein n=2 Tax=Candidatus Kaiseribacteriota TaxID=1752734 RepID=A0A1F6CYH9_9BACT|nr:MAG: hypothetical protein A2851_00990 [Candidatus Kaiserbacteria bacterium RIFCSPHIGHO2_01_FULL_53_29]OGG92361.1 MAG: hypothetical protein A3H16_01980 [Candidatus Kaiserbacteria bacterium RIFCSPLOWO2_12_FULL_53_8]
MGTMEVESRKRTKKNQLKGMILETVKIAGLISLFVVAPNVIGAMAKIGLIASPRQKDVIQRASQRLVRQGLMEWRQGKLRLTEKGERELRILQLRELARNRPRKWDKKWRVLIFDIPEHRKVLRDKIRTTLQKIGFEHLQDSVWVYPYDCEDLMALLKAEFHVGDAVRYLIADAIERDEGLRRHFKLLS